MMLFGIPNKLYQNDQICDEVVRDECQTSGKMWEIV